MSFKINRLQRVVGLVVVCVIAAPSLGSACDTPASAARNASVSRAASAAPARRPAPQPNNNRGPAPMASYPILPPMPQVEVIVAAPQAPAYQKVQTASYRQAVAAAQAAQWGLVEQVASQPVVSQVVDVVAVAVAGESMSARVVEASSEVTAPISLSRLSGLAFHLPVTLPSVGTWFQNAAGQAPSTSLAVAR